MARQALVSLAGAPNDEQLAAKVATARFYCEQLLPQADGLRSAITAGSENLYALTAAALASR
jgi:hypothetical protein